MLPEPMDPNRDIQDGWPINCVKLTEGQDGSVELKIPWAVMVGNFQGDLIHGDSNGDGKNVFPPDPGDEVGFTIQPRDSDDVGGPATHRTSRPVGLDFRPALMGQPEHPLNTAFLAVFLNGNRNNRMAV